MGESACLMRSFSHPSSACRQAKEGDPIRALTESISFGRFMSESLAWEKWSTFCHNRHLEEVEQFSKPGSVAQRKAYFEAHYKKRVAMKATALLEQASMRTDNIPEVETMDKAHNDSSVDSKFAKPRSNLVMDDQQEKGIIDDELAQSADANEFYTNDQRDDLQNVKVERIEDMIEQNDELKSPIQVASSKQLEIDGNADINLATPEEKILNNEAAEMVIMALPGNKRHTNISSKSSSQSRASKRPKPSAKQASSTQLKAGTNIAPNNKKSAEDIMEKKRLTATSLHMSINFGSRFGGTRKSSLKASKGCSSTPPNPTRASVYGLSKLLSSKVHQLEDKSSSKSSRASGSKARPPIISSPFSFRSEERAAKRKEEKAEYDLRKQRRSTGCRAKPSEELQHELRSTSNPVKKVNDVLQLPATRPRSPKLGRKTTPSVEQVFNILKGLQSMLKAPSMLCRKVTTS